jgi:hypothetical protein
VLTQRIYSSSYASHSPHIFTILPTRALSFISTRTISKMVSTLPFQDLKVTAPGFGYVQLHIKEM